MRRDGQINFSVNDEELAAIDDSAKEAGMKRAEWVRGILRYAAGLGSLREQLKRAERASPWQFTE